MLPALKMTSRRAVAVTISWPFHTRTPVQRKPPLPIAWTGVAAVEVSVEVTGSITSFSTCADVHISKLGLP